MSGATAGGVVVRFDAAAAASVGIDALAFLPAQVSRRAALASGAIALGGSPPLTLGLVLVEGRLLTLVAIGVVEPRGPVVICERPEGEPFALGSLAIIATGIFQVAPGGVLFDGIVIRELDVVDLFGRIESAAWELRAGPPASSLPAPDTTRPAVTRPR